MASALASLAAAGTLCCLAHLERFLMADPSKRQGRCRYGWPFGLPASPTIDQDQVSAPCGAADPSGEFQRRDGAFSFAETGHWSKEHEEAQVLQIYPLDASVNDSAPLGLSRVVNE